MLTAHEVPRLPPGEHSDPSLPGFGLRVSPKGKRVWYLRYRIPGEGERRERLGTFPEVGLGSARKAARRLLGRVAGGEDPRGEDARGDGAQETVEEVGPLTLREAGERALDTVLSLKARERTIGEYRRIFLHDLVPEWGDRPVESITRTDVASLATKVAARGSPIMANRVLGFARLLWNAMMDLELAPSNPASKPKRFMREERPRERALSKKELKAVLRAGAQEGPEARAFILLVAYTGQRAGAVAAAEWTEFDLEARTWRIPAAEGRKFKGHDRLLPMNDSAMRALGILQEEVKQDPMFLLPSRGGARGKTYSGWHNLVRRLRKRAGVDGWSIHTFRATFRGLAVRDLKVRADVCDLVLGHSIGTTGFRFYEADKLTFGLSEKKEALEAWGSYLDRLVKEEESNG